MSLFEPFKKTTGSKTPQFLNAEILRAGHESKQKMQENALRSQNMLGAAEIYNEATPDSSPISDSLFGPADTGTPPPGADPILSGAETLAADTSTYGAANLGASGAPIAGAAPVAAPTAMTAGGTGGMAGAAALPSMAPVAAGSTAGAGAGLAAMGPAGWAAMAAMALGLMG